MMYKMLFGLILGLVTAHTLPAQMWQDVDAAQIPDTGQRDIQPRSYRSVRFDSEALLALLDGAPDELLVPLSESQSILHLPMPDGQSRAFRLVRYQMMESELAGRFPQFRTLRGIGVDDPHLSLRLDWTPRGLHAKIRGEGDAVFIDPYARGNVRDHIVYRKKDLDNQHDFHCPVAGSADGHKHGPQGGSRAGDCSFRTYRLAVATTAEYSQFHEANSVADQALVLAAVVTAVNRVNEVYERDLGVRLLLINGTTSLFYYDAATDPYTNGNTNQMINQNQSNTNSIIGAANYDIGHVFGTNSGGLAGLGVVCSNGNKARGVTGSGAPVNDPFYIDYVAHEMGHQFGANHTFNNSCGGNRANNTAMEPGSGATIMAYAGICPPNVQSLSDDYFHGISILQISNYITSGQGDNCPVILPLPNNAPQAFGEGSYTIPVSTPFFLEGEALDLDGDPLSFCWEQFDNEVATMPPLASNALGPAFRSLDPSPSPRRYFPNLPTLLSNSFDLWEVLPAVSRNMEFRLSLRDNNANFGCTDEVTVNVASDASAGPFVVLSPNSNTALPSGGTTQVQWDVAGTDGPAVNCAFVDILLSTNGGQSYSIVLAANVPNNGLASVVFPALTGGNFRIMVRCSDNIFFDISNSNFSLVNPGSNYGLALLNAVQSSCLDAPVVFDIALLGYNGYNAPVSLSVADLPAGLEASFGPGGIGDTVQLSINLLQANIAPGTYNFSIIGNSNAGQQQVLALLQLDLPVTPTLLSPAEGAQLANASSLSWSDTNADLYYIQIATDPDFANILVSDSTAGNSYLPQGLPGDSILYWRVSASTSCGTGTPSPAASFATPNCSRLSAEGLPISIPSQGTPSVSSSIEVAVDEDLVLTDISVYVQGTHSWISDLSFSVQGPDGTEVFLMDQVCDNENNFNLGFNDNAANPYTAIPCPPTSQGLYQPLFTLGAFVGQNPSGTWTLTVSDAFNQDGGSLQEWSLDLCLGDSVISSSQQLAQGLGLSVYPNPSTGQYWVKADWPGDSASAEVFDMAGKKLWQQDLAPAAGQLYFELDLSAFPAGVYVLRLRSGQGTANSKLIKY